MDIPSGAQLRELISALAPGIVILGVRQCFVAAPRPKLEERVLSFACVSIIYYAVAAPLAALAKQHAGVAPWALGGLEYLVVPSLIGTALGIATHYDFMDVVWDKIGVSPVHHAPTAWDYLFSRVRQAPFVLVTLTDGSQVAGRYGKGSFSSSSDAERDLLIGEVYDINHNEPWKLVEPPKSILLCGKDIRFVEIFREPSK